MFLTLLVRGLVGLVFAATLTRAFGRSWEGYFGLIGQYLLIDGAIAAVVGAALLREGLRKQRGRERILGIVLLVDAAGRLIAGAALFYWPGLSGFPITAVVFVAIMGCCTAAAGVVEAWLTAREEIARHGREHGLPQFMAGPVAFTSLLSTVFGIAVLMSIGAPGRTQWLISSFIAAAAMVSLAVAWSAHHHRRLAG